MKTCAHCGRRFSVGASMTVGTHTYPLCHPNSGIDCYKAVTVYGELIGARRPDWNYVLDYGHPDLLP